MTRHAGARRGPRALARALACALACAGAAPLDASAQSQRPARPLATPTAEFEEPFTGPLVAHELRDGRLLVHDRGEKRLAVADFRDGSLTDVARMGAGPTEYQSVIALLRAPGDSVWLYDISQQRRLILAPDGRPVRTQAFVDGQNMMALLTRPMVREVDRAGATYGELRAMAFDGGRMTMSDSVVLVRERNGRSDTVAVMPSFLRAPDFSPQKVRMQVPGFPPIDAWGVFPDGRVMVVRGTTYVPELYFPDGTRRAAAAIPHPRLAVTAADKAALLADTRRQVDESMRQMRAMAPPNATLPEFEIVEPEPWQSHKPALTGARIHVDAKGRAWVPALDASGEEGRYDLLDADGRLVDAVKLPKGARLLAFGAGVVYVTRTDADDLVYVRKVPLP